MAESKDHTNAELASRLEDHANDLIDGGKDAHEIEPIVRLAAARLRHADDQMPLIPRFVGELRRIAFNALDLDTKRSLQALLGELQ
jgi:hypothetical protein